MLDIIVDKARNRPSDRVFVVTFFMGGAINASAAEDTAYSERDGELDGVDRRQLDGRERRRQGHLVGARGLGPVHELGTGSLYLNFTGVSDEAATVGCRERVRQGESPAARRDQGGLRPDNFFRVNNNILPAG